MAAPGWKCKKCKSVNQPEDLRCGSCGAKKPSLFTSPILYIAAGGGVVLAAVVILVLSMMAMPEKKYKEALEKIYKDGRITEDEKAFLAKVQKQWNISDEKAKAWQQDVKKSERTEDRTTSKPKQIGPTPPGKALEDVPVEAKLNLQQGMNYVKSKDYENAIKEFTLAIEKYQNYAVAYSNRGVAYMQQRKFNKAMDDLLKASEIDPKDNIVHYNLTCLYSLQNQVDRALDSLEKALSFGFNDYDALRDAPDLLNLRKNPEFRKTLERHKIFILK